MFRSLILVGLGTAGAVYFLDAKKGPKRRKNFQKQFRQTRKRTQELLDGYSQKLRVYAQDYSEKLNEQANTFSKVLNERVNEYGKEAKTVANDLAKNGHRRWTPSARTVGALGSALAFYGAGRSGATGMILRTLSLGLFTRALIASR
jgi:hypothetical protein